MATKAAAKKKKNIFIRFFSAIGRFFKNTVGEMKRVVWPSAKEVRSNLVVVLVFVFIMAVIIIGLDFLFGLGIQGVLDLATNIKENQAADASSTASSLSEAAKATVRWLTTL